MAANTSILHLLPLSLYSRHHDFAQGTQIHVDKLTNKMTLVVGSNKCCENVEIYVVYKAAKRVITSTKRGEMIATCLSDDSHQVL